MVKQTLDITDILQFSKLNITLSAGILLWNQEDKQPKPSEDVTTTATSLMTTATRTTTTATTTATVTTTPAATTSTATTYTTSTTFRPKG